MLLSSLKLTLVVYDEWRGASSPEGVDVSPVEGEHLLTLLHVALHGEPHRVNDHRLRLVVLHETQRLLEGLLGGDADAGEVGELLGDRNPHSRTQVTDAPVLFLDVELEVRVQNIPMLEHS